MASGVTVEVLAASDLAPAHADRWAALQALTPDFANPLLGPDFARLIARHKPDARVLIASLDGAPVGYMAFHPVAKDRARPIGAPFGDCQALVVDPARADDLRGAGPAILACAGVRALGVTGLIDPHGLFPHDDLAPLACFRLSDDGAPGERMEALRAASPKWAKNLRRLGHKIEREIGPLVLKGHDADPAAYAAVLDWKSGQMRRTGITDVLRPAWVRAMMGELFERPAEGPAKAAGFGGFLMTLRAGDRLVAGHFGVRRGGCFHPWIASTAPGMLGFSPGILLLAEALGNLEGMGLETIDLSTDHGHYKGQFCREPATVLAGAIGVAPGLVHGRRGGAWATIARRLDHIASVEPGLGGRLDALGRAVLAAPRRLAARAQAAGGSGPREE